MKVTVFGTGYVGLVTGTCLAEVGHQVVCVDIDPAKVAGLNNGVIPIYEPGLEDMVLSNHASGRLQFTTDAASAVAHGDILFVAVGTPPDEDGSADLQYVLTVARTIGEYLARPVTIVNKSKPGVRTTASGLQYQVIRQGAGPKPKATDTVRVNYKGSLLNGKQFDSSYDRGQPAEFALNQVIPGWTEGVGLMPVGSKYRLWVPSNLAYGPAGQAPIGPNSTLVFEVELLAIVK